MNVSGSRIWMYATLGGLFIGLATFAIFDSEAGWLQVRELEKQHQELAAEARNLEARRDFLSERLELLEDGDPMTLEAVAREKNLIHPGDTVYRIHFRPSAELHEAR